MDNDPKHTSKVVEKCLKDIKSRYWRGHHRALPQFYRKWVGRTEKACASKEEWANIHPTYCGKLLEGYPKHVIQFKQFKGNATKY